MARNTKAPVQQELLPANEIERFFLDSNRIYQGQAQHQGLMIEAVQMNSANNDLTALVMGELNWPTKDEITPSTVQYTPPGASNVVTDTVYRKRRVPMTPEEAVAHFAQMAGVRAESISESRIAIDVPKKKAVKKAKPKTKPKAKKSTKKSTKVTK